MQVLPLQDLIELLEADQAKAPEHHRKGGLLELGLLKAQAQCVLAQPKRAAEEAQQLGMGSGLRRGADHHAVILLSPARGGKVRRSSPAG